MDKKKQQLAIRVLTTHRPDPNLSPFKRASSARPPARPASRAAQEPSAAALARVLAGRGADALRAAYGALREEAEVEEVPRRPAEEVLWRVRRKFLTAVSDQTSLFGIRRETLFGKGVAACARRICPVILWMIAKFIHFAPPNSESQGFSDFRFPNSNVHFIVRNGFRNNPQYGWNLSGKFWL